MKTAFLLVILLSIFGYSSAQAPPPTIYSVVTLFGGQLTETIVYTVKIDLANGTEVKLLENFLYIGGSGTYDGISDMDETTGVYYFSNNFATSFIYSSNVYTHTLLPTIDTFAKEVLNIHHDSTNQRLLSLQLQQTGTIYFIEIPTSVDSGKASILLTIPDEVSPAGVISSGFDEINQKLYLAAINTTNTTGSYYLSSYDVTTGQIITASPIPLSCPTGQFAKSFPTYMTIDNTKNQLLVAVEDFVNGGDIDYWIYILSFDGRTCVAKKVPLSTFGIATAWTYYEPTRTFYFSLAPNGPAQLLSFNVDTGVLGKPLILQAVPSSLQVSTK